MSLDWYSVNHCECYQPGVKYPCPHCRDKIKQEIIDQKLCPGCGENEIHKNSECVRLSIFEEIE